MLANISKVQLNRAASYVHVICSNFHFIGITSETKKVSNVRGVTRLEPRVLGMVMVPGKHISSVYVDESIPKSSGCTAEKRYEEVNVNIVDNESNHIDGFAGWIPKQSNLGDSLYS